MKRATTKIVWDIDGNIVEHECYYYVGRWSWLCGASGQQKEIEAEQQQQFQQTLQQQSIIFGESSKVFDDMMNTFAPILAKGPMQEGMSAAEKQTYQNQITNQTGEGYSKAANALNEEIGAQGGGNVAIQSGANNQLRAGLLTSAAQQEGNERAQVTEQDYALGRENFNQAASALSRASSVFNPATESTNAATGAGSAAATTANQITEANNSWVGAVTGALGGVAGSVMTGGMSNLGKGVGFFGANAPAPGSRG